MEYAGIHHATLQAEPFVLATATQIGVWLRLHVYAASQESPIIRLPKGSARVWLATANVTPEEVEDAVSAGLCEWLPEGGLRVIAYDMEGQRKVEARRRAGGKGGKASVITRTSKQSPSKAASNAGTVVEASREANGKPFRSDPIPSLPILTDPIPPIAPPGGRVRSKPSGYSDEFKTWYASYPKKLAPGAAWRAWQKADRPALAPMLAALEWQRNLPDWTKDKGAFVPYPATYLNARRWEDERPQTQRAGPPRIEPERAARHQALVEELIQEQRKAAGLNPDGSIPDEAKGAVG